MPRHHVVPQMLLRRFADADGRLVMVGRNPPHRVVPTTVRTAAAVTDYYRIETDDVDPDHREGHDPEAVEKVLAGLEGEAAPMLDGLAAGRPTTVRARFQISFFIAMQHVRVPAFRADLDRLGTLLMRAELEGRLDEDRVGVFLRERGSPNGPDDVRGFLERAVGDDGPTLRMSQPHAVQASIRHGLDTVMPALFSRAWTVLRFDHPVLLIGDAPVAAWSPPRRDGLPVGIADAREVYLPLDRRTALVVTGRPAGSTPDRYVVGARNARAARINRAVADGADRWVFHHPDDRPMDHVRLGPPARWERDVTEVVVEEADATVRVRGMHVKRQPRGEPAG